MAYLGLKWSSVWMPNGIIYMCVCVHIYVCVCVCIYIYSNAMDMNLGKLWEMVRDREAWRATVHGVMKNQTQFGDWTNTRVCVCVCACSVVQSLSDFLQAPGLQPVRYLYPWNFPGKNTGVGYHFLLQRIFSTQGLSLCLLYLLHWQMDSLPLCHLGIHICPVTKFCPTLCNSMDCTEHTSS